MLSGSTSLPDEVDTVPLFVRRTATVDLQRAVNELGDIGWLGVGRPDVESSTRVVTTELELPLRNPSSGNSIRIPALMEVGLPVVTGQAVAVDLSWRSATLTPLFPLFVGRLVVTAEDVTLSRRVCSRPSPYRRSGRPPARSDTAWPQGLRIAIDVASFLFVTAALAAYQRRTFAASRVFARIASSSTRRARPHAERKSPSLSAVGWTAWPSAAGRGQWSDRHDAERRQPYDVQPVVEWFQQAQRTEQCGASRRMANGPQTSGRHWLALSRRLE